MPPLQTNTVWGYPIAVRGLIDTRFRRRGTTGTLANLLNTALLNELKALGMPDRNSDVILLDGGHLMPGHSGAPLLDSQRLIVAIADGGLERGAVEVSWAIPATQLQQLAASTQHNVAAGIASVSSFPPRP